MAPILAGLHGLHDVVRKRGGSGHMFVESALLGGSGGLSK